MKWSGWWSIRDPKKRAAAKLADEQRLAANPPALPAWDVYRGPESIREEPDYIVSIRGNYERRYATTNPEFARLAALAGLPAEIMDCQIVTDGEFFVVTSPRGNRGYFHRGVGVAATRVSYKLLTEKEHDFTQ
jgi:hypothetical protein